MSHFRHFLVLLLVLIILTGIGKTQAIDSPQVKAMFANPSRDYTTAPLWVWNDMLTEEQIRSTLHDLASQGVKQVFVHPRPGLMTPYLSSEWFGLLGIAMDEAKKLDMNIWIYDENSYPSGFAGGHVPAAMPDSRGQGLSFNKSDAPPDTLDDVIGVYLFDGDAYRNITDDLRHGKKQDARSYLIAKRVFAQPSAWLANYFYVDLLKPGVAQKFLDLTLEPYRKRFGDEFGKQIPGVFTDEPHLVPYAGQFHWTNDLDDVFKKRWGYSLIDNLPSLVEPVANFKRVRYNYYQLLMELFIERWAKPYYEYCQKYNLEFTGHYWEHEWPSSMLVPDNMAMSAWQQRPGIDILLNNYSDRPDAQVGNVRVVNELSSIANQLGRQRTLCEAYGAAGWDLRFEDMKRIGDWLYVLGVNTLDQHLSYITIRGARKRDHPQSFSYHEPWWPDYHIMAAYFARLSAAMSSGQQINKILVIEPTTTAWFYNGGPKSDLDRIGMAFHKTITHLAQQQVEFDIGCEDIMARHGSVEGASLKVGHRAYSVVVLPPLTETVNNKTMDLLQAYCKKGGKLLCCGDVPSMVEAMPSDRNKALSSGSGFKHVEQESLAQILLNEADGFKIQARADSNGILLHHRRILGDGELLFITNTHILNSVAGTIDSAMGSVEQWDLVSGKVVPYPFRKTSAGIKADFELAPCGSLLLFLSNTKNAPMEIESKKKSKITADGQMKIHRIGLNVLTLDYVDITAGTESRQGMYFYPANQFAFDKNGMERNPWDSAVQFEDTLISKKFATGSGFEAAYRFTIEKQVPPSLYIVIERPDLYKITCNGTPLAPKDGQWWLDKAFSKIDITKIAIVGENKVTIKASPFTVYHELESAYFLGDFALKTADSGFVIVPDTPLGLGKWNEQGQPFYAEGVSYTQKFDISPNQGQYCVVLPSWYGSVARVIVNGRQAGHIYHQPWQCDITGHIKSGTNTIEVVVVGTLKNTLGPHHDNPPLGIAGPWMFQIGPANGPPAGAKYSNVGYGLFETFELINVN